MDPSRSPRRDGRDAMTDCRPGERVDYRPSSVDGICGQTDRRASDVSLSESVGRQYPRIRASPRRLRRLNRAVRHREVG